jgi:hypothetical protein
LVNVPREDILKDEDRMRLMPVLEAIEKILRPHFEALPHDAMPWTAQDLEPQ